MKNIFALTVAAGLSVSAAYAGGLAPPVYMEPPVVPPTVMVPSWTGPYAGLTYGRTTTTETWLEPTFEDDIRTEFDGEVCKSPGIVGSHGSYKCKFDDKDGAFTSSVWGSSPEIQALRLTDEPWNDDDLERTGNPLGRTADAEVVRYSEPNYNGIWLNGEDFEFTYNYREVNLGPVQTGFETFTEENTEETYGAFVGYRHQVGQAVFGLEGAVHGELTSLEAQLGLAAGPLLPYVSYGVGQFDSEDVTTYGGGADFQVGLINGMFVGADAIVIEDNSGNTAEQATIRVGFNF